jgi:hypothetical protein
MNRRAKIWDISGSSGTENITWTKFGFLQLYPKLWLGILGSGTSGPGLDNSGLGIVYQVFFPPLLATIVVLLCQPCHEFGRM